MQDYVKLGRLEERALKLLLKYGDRGLLQSELWHLLGITSRDGSRVAIKLEKRGLIKRVREFANDRWTMRLISLVKPLDLSIIRDSPCPPCPYNDFCGVSGTYTPTQCVLIESWLLSLVDAKAGRVETTVQAVKT
ncbi:MAG: hypothetical protein RMJ28_05750 [Nitrososphaerota archaeon]|nr:hypothetical protein [Candidatus Calditenuaceae archaeon]MDW8073718.1 hypothetical protein [Nitrososphaerota archaeon]